MIKALNACCRTGKVGPIGISASKAGEQNYRIWKFIRLVAFDIPVLPDSNKQACAAWNVMTLSTSTLLDADSHVRYRAQDEPDWDSAETLSAIRALPEPISKLAEAFIARHARASGHPETR